MSELGHHVDNTAAMLRQIVETIERLEEEGRAINLDKRDKYGEAKGLGLDVKAIKTIVRLRRQDTNVRLEEEAILQTYMAALGME